LSDAHIEQLTQRVAQAQASATAIPKLTEDFPQMTLGDGYAVQRRLLEQHLKQGDTLSGWKAGLTSKAKMDQMGVRVPSVGFLLHAMARAADSVVNLRELVHPRVECEVAFVTKAPLSGAHCTREEVWAATDYVVPAIEIIDSRFSGFKFDLQSVVADNSSSARYVLGNTKIPMDQIDVANLGVVLQINGQTVAQGTSAAVAGHPADAVALVVKVLDEIGQVLPAGSVVLSGGITEALAVKSGDVASARFERLGDVAIRFE
jgi:2-oxo-3-hexenedioate decarboxylase